MIPLHVFVAMFLGWLQDEQHKVIECLREENRVLKAQLRGQRVRLTDDERRRLAVLGAHLRRRILAEVATIVTPDTILRWHRQLIARGAISLRTFSDFRPSRLLPLDKSPFFCPAISTDILKFRARVLVIRVAKRHERATLI